MTDTIVKIITALVIAKCWYIGWAFRWVVETPLSCLAKTLLIIFFTALALHTRRIYPQVILGLIWFIVFFPYSIFADKITFVDPSEFILYSSFVLLLSVPVMLNILYRGMNDINNIRRSAFDFRTPRRDALLPYFCLIALLIIFLFFLTNFASISGFMPKIIWRCLFFGLSALCLLPLPAAFSRRLKARHVAAPTPPEAQNCKTDTPQKTTRFPFWHKYQPCFRLTIVVLCIFAMLESGLTLLIPCLIIGVCEEFILLYKLRKTILPPQTPTAKQPFGSSSANNIAQPALAIPVSVNSICRIAPQNFDAGTSRSPQNFDINTSRAPLLLAQQSLLQKQRRARCRNFFLHAVGIIILLILFTFLSIGMVNYGCCGNINTAERRFGKITSDEQLLHDRYYF
jgi:membrane protein